MIEFGKEFFLNNVDIYVKFAGLLNGMEILFQLNLTTSMVMLIIT